MPDRAELAAFDDAALLVYLEECSDDADRDLVNECLARGERLIAPLVRIIGREAWWAADDARRWAVVHASLILGALLARHPSPAGIEGLVTALRLSLAHDVDDVSDAWNAIIAAIGEAGVARATRLLRDRTEDLEVRAWASEAIGVAADCGRVPPSAVRGVLRETMADTREPWSLRIEAAAALLDAAPPEDRDVLIEFAREDARRLARGETRGVIYGVESVEAVYAGTRETHRSAPRDWLTFYDGPERAARARARLDAAEDARWAAAVEAGASWVDANVRALVRSYRRSLPDTDPTAAAAVDLARRMARFLVFDQKRAPWRWDGWTMSQFRVFETKHREATGAPAPGLAEALRFVRWLESVQRVTAAERATCEFAWEHLAPRLLPTTQGRA